MRFRGTGGNLLSGEEPEDEATDREPRKCLVETGAVYTLVEAGARCKQYGGDGCRWNMDAIVDCPYVRGDDVDVTEWEID